MNFKNIYKETEENLRLALLSLWTPGKHPMRQSITEMLDREPLITEPVFQSTFGWETVEDDSWKKDLDTRVIEKLGIGVEYPPYKHQAKSWHALNEGKSIVVTSGTGSGKTECFMYPVISDLYQQRGSNAIQALFLYPLNALMEDQKKRLNDYCKDAGLKFAVYNGNTPDYRENPDKMSEEVGTRELIRDKENSGTRPQILLTNPSMLEYILVRQRDQVMLEASAGQLRWIVIDEAHSYSGSAAVELAYQIKRIIEAFKVDPNQVRFACTSATIGGPEGTASLINFISTVIGQDPQQIEIIGGNRIVPQITPAELKPFLDQNNIDVDAEILLRLRDDINKMSAIELRQIWERLCRQKTYNAEKALELIDKLCELKVGDRAVLSLRGHFFMRSISGIYACANSDCPGTSDTPYGHLTTYKASLCPHCNRPLLELVQCKRCGEFILMGESDPQTHIVHPCEEGVNHGDYFSLDDELATVEDEEEGGGNGDTFFAIPFNKSAYYNPLSSAHSSTFSFIKKASHTCLELHPNRDGKWVDLRKDAQHSYCPKCGKLAQGKRMYFKYFRIPISFINQTISPVFLKESAPVNQTWGKYIAFTDSRQGTAISAKTFNIEVERRICRQRTVEELAKRGETPVINWNVSPYCFIPEAQREAAVPSIIAQLRGSVSDSMSLYQLTQKIFDEQLFLHIIGEENDNTEDRIAYKAALNRNYLGQRQIYTQGAENLGLIMLVYPTLSNIKAPESLLDLARKLNVEISNQDWRDFLKICLDFFFRASNHIQPLISGERKFVRDTTLSTPTNEENWPKVAFKKDGEIANGHLSRLILVLCAGLGINTPQKVKDYSREIDEIMSDAWKNLVEHKLLTEVKASSNTGYNHPRFYSDHRYVGYYYLDLSAVEENTVAKVKRPTEAWVCPVSGNLLDTVFKGYSPVMVGEVSQDLFNAYKCIDKIQLPKKPLDEKDVENWLNESDQIKRLQESGLWTDRHKYAYITFPPYIAAEHSAQQSKALLKRYVEQFTNTNINVLHCSTTMEMGVDIGDIDIVLMDTIPPTPANYLQRVGRAGRKSQTKAIAFSMCNNTPIGQLAFSNPMWALNTMSHMKPVRPSATIIQRHVNSYFFRQFVCEQGEGISVTTTIGDFMDGGHSSFDAFVEFLDSMSTNASARRKFNGVFGSEVPFDLINISKETIINVKKEYERNLTELEDALVKYGDDEKRKIAISNQINKYTKTNLLNFLSENQFLPNASMPTGVVVFEFRDRDQTVKLSKLNQKLNQLRSQLKTETREAQKISLEQEIRKLSREISALIQATEASRDSRTALNEYAPQQTVVVNEKNYVSAGVRLFGAYNEATQTRALYWCDKCGKTEYKNILDENLECPRCGHGVKYRSIFDRRNSTYTLAYEPIGFRTDQNVDSSREENTDKRFYDIRPVLLQTDWTNASETNMCQISQSGKHGEILFYNAGNGNGFAFCKRCGRAVVEHSVYSRDIPAEVRPGHKSLDRGKTDEACDATEKDIARNVVFTARHQTSYSVLRFKTDINSNEYVKDESLVYSLGVILTRALVSYLGIDETEVDFGYKEELDSIALFIYDTARGGCGYSTHLANPIECEEVFSIARNMLREYSCNCQELGGACSRCLIDRNNYRYSHLLSKGKVIDWLQRQSMRAATIPNDIKAYSPLSGISYQTPKSILKEAINDGDVQEISLFVSDNAGECVLNDWISSKSEMGKTIRKAIDNGKTVNVFVEYHPALHASVEDRFPFATLSIPDVNVQLVKELGTIKTLMQIKYADGTINHFFSKDVEAISFSNDWGLMNGNLYHDHLALDIVPQEKPSLDDTSVIIREGKIINPTNITVGKYFSHGIAPAILKASDLDKMKQVLFDKTVKIHFSDMYLNSALSSMMLVYLIKEMQRLFGFRLSNLSLQIDSRKRKCVNDRFNDYMPISFNWPSTEDADGFTFRLIEDELDIVPVKTNDDAEHHRFLKFTNEDGASIDIRFDHGVGGGWISNTKYANVDYLGQNVDVRTDGSDILFYLIIKE